MRSRNDLSATSVENGISQISFHREMADRTGHLVHCTNCYAAVIVYPPKTQYEIILVEPCPMCNGLEQTFSCDYCFEKNTIYWDERHFVSKSENI
jgi:hypothetical protein